MVAYMKKNNSLINLYLNYLINRLNIIFIVGIIIVLISYLLIMINNNYSEINYLYNPEEFHNLYLKQGLLIIYILNSIIIFLISYTFNINSVGYDVLFVSNNSRYKITITKLSLSYIIIFIINYLEIVILFSFALEKYQYFKINDMFLCFIVLFISTYLELIISYIISTIFTHLTAPLVVVVVAFVYRIIIQNNDNLYNLLNKIVPLIDLNNQNMYGVLFGILYIAIGMIIYSLLYSVKELKNN